LVKKLAEKWYKIDTGKKIELPVESYMNESAGQNAIEQKYGILFNKTQHQFGGSECGIYSLNFIIRLLNGSNFDTIIKEKLDDDVVNQCREIYFNNQEIIDPNSKENFIVTNGKGGKIDIGKKNYKCE
jgi:hypothetical protein